MIILAELSSDIYKQRCNFSIWIVSFEIQCFAINDTKMLTWNKWVIILLLPIYRQRQS